MWIIFNQKDKNKFYEVITGKDSLEVYGNECRTNIDNDEYYKLIKSGITFENQDGIWRNHFYYTRNTKGFTKLKNYIIGIKMTEEEALIKTIEQWAIILGTTGTIISLSNLKTSIAKSRNWSYKNDCPCCEYVKQNADSDENNMLGWIGYKKCIPYCPLNKLWPKGCEHTSTKYSQADYDVNKINECAVEIIAECARRLDEERIFTAI